MRRYTIELTDIEGEAMERLVNLYQGVTPSDWMRDVILERLGIPRPYITFTASSTNPPFFVGPITIPARNGDE